MLSEYAQDGVNTRPGEHIAGHKIFYQFWPTRFPTVSSWDSKEMETSLAASGTPQHHGAQDGWTGTGRFLESGPEVDHTD